MPTTEQYKEFLHSAGCQPTEENIRQLSVMMEVLHLYNDRSASYGNVWQQYGALSMLLQAARKVDRLMAVWWHGKGEEEFHKDMIDDALDAVNYLVFFIRMARMRVLTGTAPERPA